MNYTDLAQSVIEIAKKEGSTLLGHNNFRIRRNTKMMRDLGLRPWAIHTVRCSQRINTMKRYILKKEFSKNLEYHQGGLMYYPSDRPKRESFYVWRLGSHLNNDFTKEGGICGWHPQCSAIINSKKSGKRLLHYGGRDLAPIHHANEEHLLRITNPSLKIHYYHTHPLIINGEKMSKSKGNVYYISDASKKITSYILKSPMDKTAKFSLENFSEETSVLNQPLQKIPRRLWGVWKKRENSRRLKDYYCGDKLRKRIWNEGYTIKDLPTGSLMYKRCL